MTSGRRQQSYPRIRVDRRAARSIDGGHPWIWGDAVTQGGARLKTGVEVEVGDRNGSFLARALAAGESAGTGPALRVLTRDPRDPPIDRLLYRRIAAARRLRERCVPATTTAFRLLHGEADDLPGLVADRYDATLVLRLDTDGWLSHLPAITAALRSEGGAGIEHIVLRGETGDLEPLHGKAPPEQTVIDEGGRRYLVRPGRGQKTGFFLDQRSNRTAVQGLARDGDRALNLFSYTGGFSIALALGGASEVVSVDASESILDDCRAQFPLNGLDASAHRFLARDLFRDLSTLANEEAARPFDIIVCDPPALARRKADLDSARKAYRRLHESLGPLLAPDGLLVTASCTARLSHDDLLEDATAGLVASGRRVRRILARSGAASDHPVAPDFPEGRYLACLWLLVG